MRRRGATPRYEGEPPMRFSPLVPPRRPLFGRRAEPPTAIIPTPTSEERRLIERIMRHLGPREKL